MSIVRKSGSFIFFWIDRPKFLELVHNIPMDLIYDLHPYLDNQSLAISENTNKATLLNHFHANKIKDVLKSYDIPENTFALFDSITLSLNTEFFEFFAIVEAASNIICSNMKRFFMWSPYQKELNEELVGSRVHSILQGFFSSSATLFGDLEHVEPSSFDVPYNQSAVYDAISITNQVIFKRTLELIKYHFDYSRLHFYLNTETEVYEDLMQARIAYSQNLINLTENQKKLDLSHGTTKWEACCRKRAALKNFKTHFDQADQVFVNEIKKKFKKKKAEMNIKNSELARDKIKYLQLINSCSAVPIKAISTGLRLYSGLHDKVTQFMNEFYKMCYTPNNKVAASALDFVAYRKAAKTAADKICWVGLTSVSLAFGYTWAFCGLGAVSTAYVLSLKSQVWAHDSFQMKHEEQIKLFEAYISCLDNELDHQKKNMLKYASNEIDQPLLDLHYYLIKQKEKT